jgi:hypothetical protein
VVPLFYIARFLESWLYPRRVRWLTRLSVSDVLGRGMPRLPFCLSFCLPVILFACHFVCLSFSLPACLFICLPSQRLRMVRGHIPAQCSRFTRFHRLLDIETTLSVCTSLVRTTHLPCTGITTLTVSQAKTRKAKRHA